MSAKHCSSKVRFLKWLRPDAEARRYLPVILLAMSPWVYLAISGADYAVTCHHDPDILGDGRGNFQYTCLDPVWTVTCSETVRSETTDVCIRGRIQGITFINHFRSNLELECKSTRGPSAYIKGSEGCKCDLQDANGRCVDPYAYCQSHYGEEAYPDIVYDPDGTIETFIAKKEGDQGVYGVCRCPEGKQFDVAVSRCI